jgi:hypothetical protein
METLVVADSQASHRPPMTIAPDTVDPLQSATIAPTVATVLKNLLRHPARHLIHRWNWKSAVLSSLVRASIFFFANLVAGLHAAIGALLAELVLRTITSGFYGAVTEAFSEARPAWAALATAMVVLPVINHSVEFLVHWARGTPKLGLSIMASVMFTAISTAFNLYAMRHGVLTVGGKSKTLSEDLRLLLPLLGQFLLAGPRAVVRYVRTTSGPVKGR